MLRECSYTKLRSNSQHPEENLRCLLLSVELIGVKQLGWSHSAVAVLLVSPEDQITVIGSIVCPMMEPFVDATIKGFENHSWQWKCRSSPGIPSIIVLNVTCSALYLSRKANSHTIPRNSFINVNQDLGQNSLKDAWSCI